VTDFPVFITRPGAAGCKAYTARAVGGGSSPELVGTHRRPQPAPTVGEEGRTADARCGSNGSRPTSTSVICLGAIDVTATLVFYTIIILQHRGNGPESQ